MKKLLVTGALGHIGSKFIREANLDSVESIVLLDNLSTQRYASLFDLPRQMEYRFVEDDVRTANLAEYLDGVDTVVHLAAITDAETSFERAEEVEDVNLEASRRVAEACADSGCGMVFVSTTSVYGPQSETVDEECGPEDLRPQSPYAETKLRAERLLKSIADERQLRFVTCRFGTIFGASPGMRFHTAVNRFVWQACNGIPLTVWRTAMDQRRPYLYLGDAVAALNFIVDNDLFDGRVYNVVTTSSTVADLISVIRRHVPDVAVEYVDSAIMNQLSFTVSGSRFQELGFRYDGTLERGIHETVELLEGITVGQ